jgi:DNA-binding CsgD family transcriptional regulator/PAS domain-containing protein
MLGFVLAVLAGVALVLLLSAAVGLAATAVLSPLGAFLARRALPVARPPDLGGHPRSRRDWTVAMRADHAASDLLPAEIADGICAFHFPLVLRDELTGTILLANRAASRLIRTPVDQMVGRPASDFVQPAYEVAAASEALKRGAIEDLRARRRLNRSDGAPVEVLVWTKTMILDGRRCALTLLLPEEDLHRLERDPVKPWRDLAPIAVGTLDRSGRIVCVSSEVSVVLGGTPPEWVGRPIEGILADDDAQAVHQLVSSPAFTVTNRDVKLHSRNGTPKRASLMLARDRRPGQDSIAFAIIGSDSEVTVGAEDRARDLEVRLRRIGAEVRAAGVLDVLAAGELDIAQKFPELSEMSTRQWDILSRLRRGDRVATIAKELYVSPSTVRNHLSGIFRKFGVHSQAELLALLTR